MDGFVGPRWTAVVWLLCVAFRCPSPAAGTVDGSAPVVEGLPRPLTTESGLVSEDAPSSPGNVSHWIRRDYDAEIDDAMPDVARHILDGNLDPFPLGDLGTPDLSDCRISGLSTLYRAGSCGATFDQVENAVVVRGSVGFRRLAGSCRFSKRWLFVQHRGTIAVGTEGVTASVLVRQTLRPEARPELRSLDVDIAGDVELEVRGHGALSFVVDALQTLYRRRMKRLVGDALRRRFRDFLADRLHRVTLSDLEWAFARHNYSALLEVPANQ